MRVHPSDPAYIAIRGPFTSWQEIGYLIEERQQHRRAILEERRDWGRLQDAAEESWE